jgi:hypothetical protein
MWEFEGNNRNVGEIKNNVAVSVLLSLQTLLSLLLFLVPVISSVLYVCKSYCVTSEEY